jgi:hypothetical protein
MKSSDLPVCGHLPIEKVEYGMFSKAIILASLKVGF